MLRAILISTLTTIVHCDTPVNDSEVIVTHEGHSEVENAKPTFFSYQDMPDTRNFVAAIEPKSFNGTADKYLEATEDVMFIPNEKPVMRNEDYLHDNDEIKNKDLNKKAISDALEEKDVNVETESPKKDVVFISGKNKEHDNKESATGEYRRSKNGKLEFASEIKEINLKKLNCSHLDCNVTQDPVCGGKLEHNQWKYRLFLNECFFRKVNCAFRRRVNRYKPVRTEKCKNTGAQYSEKPFVHKQPAVSTTKPKTKRNETRRSFSSRRSLNVGVDGQFCTHACPSSCTDDYDPQCAVSGTGQKRVFLNHCKLDYNSCLYRVVWHRRPLSWCVGGKMADMRENRGFIAWMQRVGVVDKKGKLVL